MITHSSAPRAYCSAFALDARLSFQFALGQPKSTCTESARRQEKKILLRSRQRILQDSIEFTRFHVAQSPESMKKFLGSNAWNIAIHVYYNQRANDGEIFQQNICEASFSSKLLHCTCRMPSCNVLRGNWPILSIPQCQSSITPWNWARPS